MRGIGIADGLRPPSGRTTTRMIAVPRPSPPSAPSLRPTRKRRATRIGNGRERAQYPASFNDVTHPRSERGDGTVDHEHEGRVLIGFISGCMSGWTRGCFSSSTTSRMAPSKKRAADIRRRFNCSRRQTTCNVRKNCCSAAVSPCERLPHDPCPSAEDGERRNLRSMAGDLSNGALPSMNQLQDPLGASPPAGASAIINLVAFAGGEISSSSSPIRSLSTCS